MKVVAITRILDEADIVEAFVRHTRTLVDHHIFMDNGSHDGTLQILAALKEEGLPISVYLNRCVSFNEANHLTHMYRQAILLHGATWVLCLDVDEFVDDRAVAGGLRKLLSDMDKAETGLDAIKVSMVEYVATREDDPAEGVVPLRIKRRQEPTRNCKVMVCGGSANIDMEILDGGHGIRRPTRGTRTQPTEAVFLAHYAERSAFQYLAKVIRGWNKALAGGSGVTSSGASNHYRAPYEALRDRPANLLRNQQYMGFKNEQPGLAIDPIDYKGGPLRHTSPQDEAMRAVRSILGTVQELALRHGAILDGFPAVRAQVEEWDSMYTKIC
ncbi:glycosyltransferase family 2 protein [Lichenicoccus roseus]|uniref:glycosyltransferase family 2 protein n=1 Tax=Lichenicoccus roseus TaxID=2683649 RepID=UPI0014864696|nr:glycosyltransferase family 2 protein [Lichenicoccus roseus]